MKKVYALYDGDMAYGLWKTDDLDEYDYICSSLKDPDFRGNRKNLKIKYDPDLYIVETTEIMDSDYLGDIKEDLDMTDWPDDAVKLLAISATMEFLEAIFEEIN